MFCIRRMFYIRVHLDKFNVTENYAQHVVEVVRNAARELTYRLNFLDLVELGLQFRFFLFRCFSFSDIDENDRVLILAYPEYVAFKKKLAKYLKVNVNNILLTNGADEAISLVFNAY